MIGLGLGATLGLTGRYAVQGNQARMGLELWADDEGAELIVVDDEGVPDRSVRGYRELVAAEIPVLLGPYGSDLVRRVAPAVCDGGRLLWNHGGSADDLPRPLLATVVAPASWYLAEAVRLAHALGLEHVVAVRGPGRFARDVAAGVQRACAGLGLRVEVVDAARLHLPRSLANVAVVFAGTFEEDVEGVRRLREDGPDVSLLGCVAAGIEAFGARLGPAAEGVVGPVQWWPQDESVEVGPTGGEFARRFQARFGCAPDYPAAQAAAAAYLGAEAARRDYGTREVSAWHTTTLLGPFRLDPSWRQVGYRPVLVRWEGGRRVRLTPGAD